MTTTSIPLTELPGTGPTDARRDRWGRYLVVPIGGDTPTGFTRVTTVAKTLGSDGGLAPWKAAMAVQGLILRKGLRAQWEALMAAHNGDPWYDGEESKAECKRLVEECSAVGGANDRRDMGSALHTITALHDLGRAPGTLSDETTADIAAYAAGLAEAGIEIVPGMVEVTVVLDSYQVAGTLDRIVTIPGFPLPLINDIKTGASLEYSMQDIAVQLAAYSRASARYVQGTAADGSLDQRLPMVEVDQRWGLISWLKAGKAELELILVDLELGWEAFEKSMWTRGWRTRSVSTDLAELRTDSGVEIHPNLEALLEESVKLAQAKKAAPPADPEADVTRLLDAFPGAEVLAVEPTDALRTWLQGRIERIGADPGARATLQGRWPPGLPTLLRSTEHTAEQLAAIEALLDAVEQAHRLPFPQPRPGAEVEEPAGVLRLFPTS